MLALKLCQQDCPEKLNFQLAQRIGDGADGEVFELLNEPDKVIKFCVLYQYNSLPIKKVYKTIDATLSYLKFNKPNAYAHVHEHHYLGEYSRALSGGQSQPYILYCYVMQKLQKISEDEKKVFHSILCHEDRGVNKNYSLNKIKKMLLGMSYGLDFSIDKTMMFVENIRSHAVLHHDIHVRNIMKDSKGNFKLIDFDRCSVKS